MPLMELIRIKAAETAAACLDVPHPVTMMSGARKMPPPTPIMPDSKPMARPAISAICNGKGLGAVGMEPVDECVDRS